eukprot:GEMP01099139.1.p1 GENE.GEMP01099139.1~~GEMP01099139.1.p1  ORF type:complete len:174 (+),score=52.87 GEMP01099139.1:32-523(+)
MMILDPSKKGKVGKMMDKKSKEAAAKGKPDKEPVTSPGKGPFGSPGKKGPPPTGPAPIPKNIPQAEWEDGQPTNIPPPPGKDGESAPFEPAHGAHDELLATKKGKGLPTNKPLMHPKGGKKAPETLGQGTLKAGSGAEKAKSKEDMMKGKKKGMWKPPGKKGE